MSQERLHITFGFSGKATLVQSKLINLEKDEILCFTDPLALGPLCDLDDLQAIVRRKTWWRKSVGCIHTEGNNNFVDDNLLLLKKVISSSDRYSHIYLWLGDNANEKITTARLLSYLKKLSTPIHKLNFHSMNCRDEQGEKLNTGSLQVMREDQVLEAAKHFQRLSKPDIQPYASLWAHIRKNDAVINLFNSAGNPVAGDQTFFDEYLLRRCSETPQRSSLIVGYTLCDIWNTFHDGSVGDLFLYHRLKELANMGEIEISNPHEDLERAKMVFDVRKKVDA
ncbi:DUF1835 domain-containing protein [Sphingobacterium griseoflavum]|uniref:DUF1835 domain-containing protein n=1 Tax=Sphingobacterium griseoflavum TaxID=1474952 RepID=A0ABQ3HSS5_9SPHI|nr:DUF1835 domain-containing protein [Sphingobacterium griseoflavum]GHE31242.1 hypothetical protein GCM10017764_12930 [Sphingobacterium griseoflavum]